jgi:hypothetical protein
MHKLIKFITLINHPAIIPYIGAAAQHKSSGNEVKRHITTL